MNDIEVDTPDVDALGAEASDTLAGAFTAPLLENKQKDIPAARRAVWLRHLRELRKPPTLRSKHLWDDSALQDLIDRQKAALGMNQEMVNITCTLWNYDGLKSLSPADIPVVEVYTKAQTFLAKLTVEKGRVVAGFETEDYKRYGYFTEIDHFEYKDFVSHASIFLRAHQDISLENPGMLADMDLELYTWTPANHKAHDLKMLPYQMLAKEQQPYGAT
jgi:hypothetical protein